MEFFRRRGHYALKREGNLSEIPTGNCLRIEFLAMNQINRGKLFFEPMN